MNNIRVLIVDNMKEVRQDLRTYLTLVGDIEVVGEANNGMEAIRLARALHPQVVLMDLEMPILDGFDAARQIKVFEPSCRVIALTIHAGEMERQQALRAGMTDVIVKGAPLVVLLKAIRSAATNEKNRL